MDGCMDGKKGVHYGQTYISNLFLLLHVTCSLPPILFPLPICLHLTAHPSHGPNQGLSMLSFALCAAPGIS